MTTNELRDAALRALRDDEIRVAWGSDHACHNSWHSIDWFVAGARWAEAEIAASALTATTNEAAAQAEGRGSDLRLLLIDLDMRLRECMKLGLSAAEAYDSAYQEAVATALVAQPVQAQGEAISPDDDRLWSAQAAAIRTVMSMGYTWDGGERWTAPAVDRGLSDDVREAADALLDLIRAIPEHRLLACDDDPHPPSALSVSADALRAALAASAPSQAVPTYQQRVEPWLLACFGAEIAGDKIERNHRHLEEALELVQACGCTRSEAHQLVDYVFGRPAGDPFQEAGGVLMTLAALCRAQGIDMHAAGEAELTRVWGKVEQIRAKQAAKPKHLPLPQAPSQAGSCQASEPVSSRYAAEALLAAGHEFWLSVGRENYKAQGAVQWLTASDGALVLFTRGEYKQTLLNNIATLPGAAVVYWEHHRDEDGDERGLLACAKDATPAGRTLTDDEITAGFQSMRGESGLPSIWFHAGARWAAKTLAASSTTAGERE